MIGRDMHLDQSIIPKIGCFQYIAASRSRPFYRDYFSGAPLIYHVYHVYTYSLVLWLILHDISSFDMITGLAISPNPGFPTPGIPGKTRGGQ